MARLYAAIWPWLGDSAVSASGFSGVEGPKIILTAVFMEDELPN